MRTGCWTESLPLAGEAAAAVAALADERGPLGPIPGARVRPGLRIGIRAAGDARRICRRIRIRPAAGGRRIDRRGVLGVGIRRLVGQFAVGLPPRPRARALVSPVEITLALVVDHCCPLRR